MATRVKIHKISNYNEAVVMDGLASKIDATGVAEIMCDAADHKKLVLAYNSDPSNAAEITVKAGNGLQGVADYTAEIPANTYAILCLESGRFKNVSGENKGKIIITTSASTVQLAVFMIP